MRKTNDHFLKEQAESNEKFSSWFKFGDDFIIQKLLSSKEEEVKEFFRHIFVYSDIEDKKHVQRFLMFIDRTIRVLDLSGLLTKSIGICGKTWTVGTVAFKCKTCETDPTCCICEECFKNGDHTGHDWYMTTNSSGMCDCGDPESWKRSGFCKKHKGPESDPLEHLTDKLKVFCSALCEEMVGGLANSLNSLKKEREKEIRDEKEKVNPVRTPNISKEEYTMLKARLEELVNRGAQDDSSLRLINMIKFIVENYEKETQKKEKPKPKKMVTVYEEPSMGNFIQAIKTYISKFPCFKRFYYLAFKKIGFYETFLKNHLKYSFDNRKHLNEFYAMMITDLKFKLLFAKSFLKYYNTFMLSSIGKKDRKNLRLAEISVQILTVPGIINSLLKEQDLVKSFLTTLNDYAEKTKVEEENNITKYKRVHNAKGADIVYSPLIIDLYYIFNHKETSRQLLSKEENLGLFLNFLSDFFWACTVKRIDSDAQLWKYTFTREFYYLPKLFRIITINATNQLTLTEIKRAIIMILKKILELDSIISKTFNNLTIEGPVSFHTPTHSFLSFFLYMVMKERKISDFSFLKKEFTEEQMINVVKYNAKTLATLSHVVRRYWPRNNMGIISQYGSYFSQEFRDYNIISHTFMFQVFCSLDSYKLRNEIVKLLLESFQVEKNDLLFNVETKKNLDSIDIEKKRDLRFDFIRLLLIILFDRTFSGNKSSENMEYYIMHKLFLANREYTALSKCIPKIVSTSPLGDDEDGCEGIDDILKKKCDFKKGTDINSKSYFIIKPEEWKHFNHYYVGYSVQKLQMALLNEINILKRENPKRKDFSDSFCNYIERFIKNKFKKERFEMINNLYEFIDQKIVHQIIWIELYNFCLTMEKGENYSDRELKSVLDLVYSLMVINKYRDVNTTIKEKTKEFFEDVPFKEEYFFENFTVQVKTSEMIDGRNKSSIMNFLVDIKNKHAGKSFGYILSKTLNLFLEINKKNNKTLIIGDETRDLLLAEKEKEKKEQRKLKAKKARERILKKMGKLKTKFEEEISSELEEELDEEHTENCVFCHRSAINTPPITPVNQSKQLTPKTPLSSDFPTSPFSTGSSFQTSEFEISTTTTREDSEKFENLFFLANLSTSETLRIVEDSFNLKNKMNQSYQLHPTNREFYYFSSILEDVNICKGGSFIQFHHCTHLCHRNCFHEYWKSLLRRRRGFKGSEVLILGSLEVLCPICSRLQNALVPRIKGTIQDIIEKKIKSVVGLNSFIDRLSMVKYGIPDSSQKDDLFFLNSIIYNVCTYEVSTRESFRMFSEKNAEFYLTLLKNVFFSLHFDKKKNEEKIVNTMKVLKSMFNGIECSKRFKFETKFNNDDELSSLSPLSPPTPSSRMGNNSSNNGPMEKPKHAKKSFSLDHNDWELYTPFLSQNIFSFLVRYLVLNYESSKFFQDKQVDIFLMKCLIARIWQMIIFFKFNCESNDESIKWLKEDNICKNLIEKIDKIIDKRKINMQIPKIKVNSYKEMFDKSILVFLKRIALVKQLFNRDKGVNDSYFSDMFKLNPEINKKPNHELINLYLKYLNLELEPTVFKIFEPLSEKWLNQWFNAVFPDSKKISEDEKILTFKYLVPKTLSNTQFEFVTLPEKYEELFFKYRIIKCSHCHKDIPSTVFDLLTGSVTYSGFCTCIGEEDMKKKTLELNHDFTQNQEEVVGGNLYRYCKNKLGGIGIFIVVNQSCIVIVRGERKTVLRSCYRNTHGEDDFGLKTGRPLFLVKDYLKDLIPKYVLNYFDQDTKILSKSTTYKVRLL